MAIFGSNRRSIEARLQSSEWKNAAERDALLQALVEERPKPAEFLFLLLHPDPACRQMGANLARLNAGPAMLEALLKEAEARPESARRQLLGVAMTQPRPLLTAAIDARLGDKVPPPRQALAWQLALELPSAQRRAYVELAIRSTTGALRQTALQKYLGDLPDSAEPPQLLFELAKDPVEAVRVRAVEALEKWKTTPVIACMVDRFISDTPPVQQKALAYLQKNVVNQSGALAERLVPLVSSPEASIRKGAMQLLFSCLEPGAALQLLLAYVGDAPGWVRARTLETLESVGPSLKSHVRELLRHPDAKVRANALMVAQVMKGKGLVEALGPLVRDEDWCTRLMVVDLLGLSGEQAAVEPLLEVLDDPELRWVAVESLARIGAPRAIERLMHLVNDPEPENRCELVQALGRFSEPALMHVFQSVATMDTAETVRDCAAKAARELGERLKIPTTVKATGAAKVPQRPLDRLLQQCRKDGASDVHILPGEPPWVRRAGIIAPLAGAPTLTPTQTRDVLLALLDEPRRTELGTRGQLDFCHVIADVGRYRVNVYRQRAGLCASFRIIPNEPPTFEKLGIPERVREALEHHQGLIVLAGPSGSGKSTTLAALVNLLNQTRAQHILTVEDPVEFVHPPSSSIVNQRDVGRHTGSFAQALRGALRQDPDVIVIGELRDLETIRMALAAAETGHLVIATLHTIGAVQTVDRLVEVFPSEEHAQVRMSLYESLKFVICQTLVPRADGSGQVAAFEILKSTPSVANTIREGQTHQLHSLMQIGRAVGMQTLQQALDGLLDQGMISEDTVREYTGRSSVEPLEAMAPPPADTSGEHRVQGRAQ